MKAKLGLAVGVNVAVACLLMQGCKAPRVTDNNYGNDVKTIESQPAPQPTDDIKIASVSEQAPEAKPEQTAKPAKSAVAAKAAADKSQTDVAAQTAPAVPEATAPAAADGDAAPAEAFTLYTVRSGDMISRIARRYGLRQKAILDMNPGLSPNKLYIGKKIKLPGTIKLDAAPAAAAPVAAAPAAASASAAQVKAPATVKAAKYTGATREYVVRGGDSLGVIARRNGTNVRTIKELNGLSGDRVRIGQKLKIPAVAMAKAPKDGDKVAAKKPVEKPAAKAADKTVAKKPAEKPVAADAGKAAPAVAAPKAPEAPAAKVEAPKAPEASAAAPEAAAQPAAEAAQPTAPAPEADAAQSAAPAAAEMHTVKEGEDVVSIAISYGVSPSALMDANDLKSSEVKPGDVLKIPSKNAQ